MGGKRGGGSVTVGYRYYWDIHSGLGRGPINEIVELRVDDKTAYVGTPGEITRSQAIYIDKPGLFGGDNTGGEGGIQGRMEILMGEPDQKPSKMLINLLKGILNPSIVGINSKWSKFLREKRGIYSERDKFFLGKEVIPGEVAPDDMIPGFRGIVSTVFSGLISCYNAYPKKHSYRVRRNDKGWHQGTVWYAEKARIMLRNDNLKIKGLTAEQEENIRQIHAQNPAHILVECATNKSWGGKKDISELDIDSYKKAADTLFTEGFGLCLRYNRQDSIETFIKQVVDHIGAIQFDDVRTGKQGLRLLRNDYNPQDLRLYHYDNGVLMVQDDDSAATDTAANQVVVKYRDPVTNRDDQAIANNIAAVQMHGVISKTTEYKGIPTFDLAARVAQRDLEMVASSLMRIKVVFDMRGADLTPGDVIRLQLPDRNIEDVVFRVLQIDNTTNEGEFLVTCMQDVFGLPAANYSTNKSESLYIPPDYSAKPAPASRLMEVPYHLMPLILTDAERAFIKQTDCFVWSLASQPTALSVSYDYLVDVGAGFAQVAEGSFTPSVLIADDITPYQTQVRFVIDGDYSGLAGAEALLIDDEIVKVEAVDFNTAVMTLGRGCADTVPQAHKANARAWCYLLSAGQNDSKYTVGEQIKAKLLTRTAQETLAEDAAPVLQLTTRQRQARPYPPANVKVDGVLGGAIVDSSQFKITWAYRDRDIQADKLIAHTEDSTVLGAGVSYKVDLLDGDNVVRAISTTSSEFVYPDAAKVDGEQFSKIALYAIKDKLTSLYRYEFVVNGAMQLLYNIDYKQAFNEGDNFINRYDDSDMPGGKYMMLKSSASPQSTIYKSLAIEPDKYRRFALSYNIGTYNQREGLCTVAVQLYKGAELIKEYVSEQLGNYPKSEWHSQLVTGDLPAGVNEVRFRINVIGSISNNAIALRDIILRAGGD